MENASRALVQRRYFDCERFCLDALERAFIAADYERMARILLPLEEARRQKRQLAIDAGAVFVVNADVPTGRALKPGFYLVCPPRVGIDGRLLREAANKKKIPAVIIVREPASRDGMWPVVSIGPVTIRTKVPPPAPPEPAAPAHSHQLDPTADGRPARKRARAGKTPPRVGTPAVASTNTPNGHAGVPASPTPSWFILANEAIGDRALAGIEPTISPIARVEALLKCLQAHPDHEKLHQALGDACREAAKIPIKLVRARPRRPEDEEDL